MARARERLHVLIAGAGVGGLAAACGLAARGHRVTVLERAAALTRVGGHLGVQSNAVLALRALGAADRVERGGIPVERFEIASWSGRRLAWWSPGAIGRNLSAPSVTVPRHLLLSALADTAAAAGEGAGVGAGLLFGAEVAEVAEDPERVTVRLTDGRSLSGDVLVGADGVRSTVRRLAGLPGEVHAAGYLTWRGVAPGRPPHTGPDTARQHLGRGRTFGHWPLPDGRTYWVATRTTRALGASDAARPVPRPADLPPTVAALVAATPEAEVLRTGVDTVKGGGAWHSGRVVLLGDAAHAMEPTTGQGAAQALLDAVCLAATLGGADGTATGIEHALTTYAARRQPGARAVADEASGLGTMHHLDHPIGSRLRDTVLRFTPQSVWQRRGELRLDEHELLAPAAGAAPDAAPAARQEPVER